VGTLIIFFLLRVVRIQVFERERKGKREFMIVVLATTFLEVVVVQVVTTSSC
jgi:predicted nucleic acid-binding Zn ribbon protein